MNGSFDLAMNLRRFIPIPIMAMTTATVACGWPATAPGGELGAPESAANVTTQSDDASTSAVAPNAIQDAELAE